MIVIQVPPEDNEKTINKISWRTATISTDDDLDVTIEEIDNDGEDSR